MGTKVKKNKIIFGGKDDDENDDDDDNVELALVFSSQFSWFIDRKWMRKGKRKNIYILLIFMRKIIFFLLQLLKIT